MSLAAGIILPLAHVSHWWMYVLYAVPVIIVLGSVVMTLVKERRGGEPDEDA
ncbi:MAG: hypothetical protein ACR2G3_02815 [Solirubrobacterales bacterium]